MTSNRRFRLLVFDRDGTLMDSSATIVACMVESFLDLGLEAPPEKDMRSTIGLGLDVALEDLAPSLSQDENRRWIETYRKHWFGTYRDRPTLFAGTPDPVVDQALEPTQRDWRARRHPAEPGWSGRWRERKRRSPRRSESRRSAGAQRPQWTREGD